MKLHSLILCCVCLSSAAFDNGSALAQFQPIDDFNDGNIDGWTVYDYTAGRPYGPSRFSVVDGAFEISNGLGEGEVHTANVTDGLIALWNGSNDPKFQHGFLRAKVRTLRPTGLPIIHLRNTPGQSGYESAYEFNFRSYVDAMVINRFSGGVFPELGRASMSFNPGDDWIVEVGAVGPRVSVKAWPVGGTEPVSPQFVARDAAFEGGRIGLGVAQAGTPAQSFGANQPFGARFDDVMFRPASAWRVSAGGDWSTTANWWGSVPNAIGAYAIMEQGSAPRTLTVDVPITLGQIDFESSGAYTLAGSNPITLDAMEGDASINVTRGSHTIGAPLTFVDNALVNITPAAGGLSITSTVDALGLTKFGAGTLTVNQVRARGMSINGGTLALAPNDDAAGRGASMIGALSIAGATNAWTARLDLSDNDAVVRSSAANKDAAFSQLYNQVSQGYNNGNWQGRGITSTTAAANANADTGVSLVDNALLGLTTFGGQPVTADSILLKYTYYGDIDQNGQVDADDLTIFASNFGRTSGATQIDGDIDFNGAVNADDLTVFANNFNKGVGNPLAVAAANVQAVPEPATWALLAVGVAACGLLVRNHRRLRVPSFSILRANSD